MNSLNYFHKHIPAMLKHEGTWEGVYTHVNRNAEIIDKHKAKIICEFPSSGDYAYIQHNHFIWDDGREYKVQLPAIYRDKRLWWDTDTFKGSAWESKDNLILLNLERKDDPGANFFELIAMGDNKKHRARTWHWFKDGRLYKRTLCDEWKIG